MRKAKIFNDPITRKDFEGTATLVKKLESFGEDYEYWLVEFGTGELAERIVHKDDMAIY